MNVENNQPRRAPKKAKRKARKIDPKLQTLIDSIFTKNPQRKRLYKGSAPFL